MAIDANALPPVMTADQVADLLQMPRQRVYELAAAGKIPSIRFGRQVRFTRAGISELLGLNGTDRRREEKRADSGNGGQPAQFIPPCLVCPLLKQLQEKGGEVGGKVR
jgi:excisionase family DNA binding protein